MLAELRGEGEISACQDGDVHRWTTGGDLHMTVVAWSNTRVTSMGIVCILLVLDLKLCLEHL